MRLRLHRISLKGIVAGAGVLLLVLFAIAWTTRTPPGETPYLKIAGAGFMFNYRVADAYYGFTAQLMRPVRNASVIEAEFEDPAGGPAHLVTAKLWPATRQYGLRSPPLSGIEKERPYHVRVRLLQQGDQAVLFEESFTVTSQISDTVMPAEPLTVGPGYMKNPRAAAPPETPR